MGERSGVVLDPAPSSLGDGQINTKNNIFVGGPVLSNIEISLYWKYTKKKDTKRYKTYNTTGISFQVASLVLNCDIFLTKSRKKSRQSKPNHHIVHHGTKTTLRE